MPTREDFLKELQEELRTAGERGQIYTEINARTLHRAVCGDYPAKDQISACCDVMHHEQRAIDKILVGSLETDRGSLTIRYALPR